MQELKEKEKVCEMLSLWYNTAKAVMTSQKLWLSDMYLHKIGFIDNQSWIWRSIYGALMLPVELLATYGG